MPGGPTHRWRLCSLRAEGMTSKYESVPWSEDLVVDRVLTCADRLGWTWDREVGLPGWGRCDFLLYPKPWVYWLVEAKADLRQRGQLRRGLQQVNAYRHFLTPARTFLIASAFSESGVPYYSWGSLFDIDVLGPRQLRGIMGLTERCLRRIDPEPKVDEVTEVDAEDGYTTEVTVDRWHPNRARIFTDLAELGAHRDSDGSWYLDGMLSEWDTESLQHLGADVKVTKVPAALRINADGWGAPGLRELTTRTAAIRSAQVIQRDALRHKALKVIGGYAPEPFD